jgi:hypothetical protein
MTSIKKTRRYWKLIEEALALALLRTLFGRRYGSVIRETAE